MAVATEASRRGVPTLLVGGAVVSVNDPLIGGLPVLGSLPLLGVRFGQSVDAVASPVGYGRPHSPPPVVAVDRFGEAVLVDPLLDTPYDVSGEPSIVVDAALRALGLGTPAPDRPVATVLDTVWLDRALAATLAAPLGQPPRWGELAALHPCAPTGLRFTSPECLVHRRRANSLSWLTFRSSLVDRAISWPPITGALAVWFDHGSLCRHLFSLLPEPETIQAELGELLSPHDVARIESVMVA